MCNLGNSGFVKTDNVEIFTTEGVTIVNYSEIPAGNAFIPKVFEAVAQAGISIDMISLTPPKSDLLSFAFTVGDEDFAALLPILNAPGGFTPMVSSANAKITVASQDMISSAGFAARVFASLAGEGLSSLMVTTSEDDMSVLVAGSDEDRAVEAICRAFEK